MIVNIYFYTDIYPNRFVQYILVHVLPIVAVIAALKAPMLVKLQKCNSILLM